jgi:hypothetical protein
LTDQGYTATDLDPNFKLAQQLQLMLRDELRESHQETNL